jgi:hypothetical protein
MVKEVTPAICYELTFSPDDRFLAAGVTFNKMRIWQVDPGREYRTPVTGGRLEEIAVSPNGRLLAG